MIPWQRIQLPAALLVLSASMVRAQPPAAAEQYIAVLNFANRGQGDPSWDWLGKGLADLTIGDLASQKVKVVSREQMEALVRELELTRSTQDPQAVAKVLKATRCVHGSYLVTDKRVTLNATIIQVDTGAELHATEVSGVVEDVLRLQKQLVAELLDVLEGHRPGTVNPKNLPRWTESLPASQLLYYGIDRFDRGEYLNAWSFFRRALSQDPHYADARYWSGRMMYYVQEYRQADVDLEWFVNDHPAHPRAGDAAIEIINSVQQVAVDPAEVLEAAELAARLAPQAEVPNQFGPGRSSNVAIFAASVAGPILRTRGQFREAFNRYAAAIEDLPIDDRLYWIVWHEMLAIAIDHLQASGELLSLPAKPTMDPKLSNGKSLLSPGGLHPSGLQSFGEFARGGDEPIGREFVRLTPDEPTAVLDFSADPFLQRWTFTRYFHSDPDHFLAGLELELVYEADATVPTRVRVEGDRVTSPIDLKPDESTLKIDLQLKAPAYCASVRLDRWISAAGMQKLRTGAKRVGAAITRWKVTGRFQAVGAPSGTLVLRNKGTLPIKLTFDGIDLPLLEDEQRLEHVAAGRHLLDSRPNCWGAARMRHAQLDVPEGATIDVEYSSQAAPERLLESYLGSWNKRRVSTPYDLLRMGPYLGTGTGRPGDVRVFEDGPDQRIALWAVRRDLYMARSSDNGVNWSDTVQLPPPVNSAHEERLPVLTRAADGRYVLAFVSDRNLAHAHATYACFSYDLVNFSAPVMVSGQTSEPVSLLERSDGTFLCYALLPKGVRPPGTAPKFGDRWCVMTSDNLLDWSQPVECVESVAIPRGNPPLDTAWVVAVCRAGNGFWSLAHYGTETLRAARSADGIHFERSEIVPYKFLKEYTMGVSDAKMYVRQIFIKREQGKTLALINGWGAELVLVEYDPAREEWKQSGMLFHATQLSHPYTPGDFILRNNGVDLVALTSAEIPYNQQNVTVFGAWSPSPWYSVGQPLMANFVPYDELQITRERMRQPGSDQVDAVPVVKIQRAVPRPATEPKPSNPQPNAAAPDDSPHSGESN